MENTPVEIEIRERRIQRHLYEQDMLLADATVSVQQFDSRLRYLQRERIRVQEKNQLLELHLYQLHREMNVLNRFEAHEDRLAERVYVKLMQVRGVQDQIADCEHRIDEHFGNQHTMNHSIEEIQRQFKKLVQDNKFADFLRRIFKKKYRPPRDHDDDASSESEESSSSSEEEDEGSIDSRDIGPIRLDPTICPEGCDREVYDKTYQMRNERHKLEQDVMEQSRLVELLRKDIDAHNKIKRKLSIQLDRRKNDLREFMLEKQSCMNEVDQVVILRYDQIRASALNLCTGPEGLANTVVFPEQQLARLRQRVLELQEEIRQQRQRQKINRTHLFRMNIDLRAMEESAQELRAKMREVLTRKLGKPRRVDKTLDDLLRQMARRHKFSATLGAMPQIMEQLKTWRERNSDLEKKYLERVQRYSDRLRLAAALQADILPQKPQKDPQVMPGAYEPEQYQRDVVRLRIVRAQQLQQIQELEEEITGLRLKPLSERTPPRSPPESSSGDEEIYLPIAPRVIKQRRGKYFPITPLGSSVKLIHDVNVLKLLYDCLDTMRVTRDDADALLRELTAELADVMAGTKSRFQVVDALVKKWLLKYGGDPSQYKKQTKAFDALALLADRLIRQHVETMEGATVEAHQIMESLEDALKDVSGPKEPLHNRLGPALAALFVTTDTVDMESEETMTALVNSLIDEDNPLSVESIERIDVAYVMDDMKDCGVSAPDEAMERIIQLAVECLRAQLVEPEEAEQLQLEVEKAMSAEAASSARTSRSEDGRSARTSRSDEGKSVRASKSDDRKSVTPLKSVEEVKSVGSVKSAESVKSASKIVKSADSVKAASEIVRSAESVKSASKIVTSADSVKAASEIVMSAESVKSPSKIVRSAESVKSASKIVKSTESMKSTSETVKSAGLEKPEQPEQLAEAVESAEQVKSTEKVTSPDVKSLASEGSTDDRRTTTRFQSAPEVWKPDEDAKPH